MERNWNQDFFCAFFSPQCNDSNWQDIKGQWAVSCSILARQCWILLRKSDTTRAHPSIGIQSRDQCYCCCPSHCVSILTDVRGKTYGAFQADGKNSVEMALHPITSVRGDCECRKECRSLCHCTARSWTQDSFAEMTQLFYLLIAQNILVTTGTMWTSSTCTFLVSRPRGMLQLQTASQS